MAVPGARGRARGRRRRTTVVNGTMESVGGGTVTIRPTHFYAGDAHRPSRRPGAPRRHRGAAAQAVRFEEGRRYLVAATDGRVALCSFSAEWSAVAGRRLRRGVTRMTAPVTAGMVLAAGGGSRMGTPKALVRDPDGTSWLLRSLDVLREAGCDRLLVVLGAAADEARALLPDPLPDDLRVVVADDWATGWRRRCRRACGPCSTTTARSPWSPWSTCPTSTAEVARRVARRRPAGPDSLARATYDGRPGHPVLMGREHWFRRRGGRRGRRGRARLPARARLRGGRVRRPGERSRRRQPRLRADRQSAEVRA